MPVYEYACKACGQHLEVAQSFKDEPLTTCPACGGTLRKVFGSIAISFKGSGFYRTDSRTPSGKPTGKADKEKDKEKDKAKAGSGEGGSGSGSEGSGSASGPREKSTTSSGDGPSAKSAAKIA
jgi:putative FmdB family regulatory protein